MNKKTIICIILIIISIIITLIGFGLLSVSAIPYQDSALAPEVVLDKQIRGIYIGLFIMLSGIVLFFGTVIGRIVIFIIDRKRNI